MIQLLITKTGKSYSPKDEFHMLYEETKNFPDLRASKDWIKEQYGKSKRSPIYRDFEGKAKRVGYVIGFHNSDLSHYPVNKWIQQDWIEFREIKTITI